MSNIPLFVYGMPGPVGGAATKITHLLRLLKDDADLRVIAPNVQRLNDRDSQRILKSLNISACLIRDLPPRIEGTALAICERDFFQSAAIREMRRRGLRIVWSNEMMFPFPGEAEAAGEGLIDRVLYVSRHQADAFREMHGKVPNLITGNYIDPTDFPTIDRRNSNFVLGRLSRPDPEKYPLDFPAFYEEMNLPEARYRVMAWNGDLERQYRWHHFGPQWELLPANRETAPRFLGSLDLFLYPLGHRVKESWGRAIVEAMLTGAIPVVPAGHHFEDLMVSGESGFICQGYHEFRACVRELYENAIWRRQVSLRAAAHAQNRLCHAESHRQLWREALTF